MTAMKSHLISYLSGILSVPVRWEVFPQGAPKNRVFMSQPSGRRDMSLDGKGLIEGRVQADCFGETSYVAATTAKQVQDALEGYVGGPVLRMFLDAIRDNIKDDAGYLPCVSLTFSITYRD